MNCRSLCALLAVASLAIPLIFVTLAALQSPWFSLLRNALSDLGHEVCSPVALVFNSGLGIGGVLVGVYTARCLWRTWFALPGAAMGVTLALIGVVDEYYGRIHFSVSAAFFLSMAAFLAVYVARRRSLAAAVALSVAVALWFTYFAFKMPKGAAIPELVSVFALAPFYVGRAREVCSEVSG